MHSNFLLDQDTTQEARRLQPLIEPQHQISAGLDLCLKNAVFGALMIICLEQGVATKEQLRQWLNIAKEQGDLSEAAAQQLDARIDEFATHASDDRSALRQQFFDCITTQTLPHCLNQAVAEEECEAVSQYLEAVRRFNAAKCDIINLIGPYVMANLQQLLHTYSQQLAPEFLQRMGIPQSYPADGPLQA